MLDDARPTLVYDGRTIHSNELDDNVGRLAGAFAKLGLGRGDRLALWLPNCPMWIYAHLAAARIGVITVAVNTRFRSAEVEDIVARSGARTLIYWPGFLDIDFDAILSDVDVSVLDTLDHVLVYQESDQNIPSTIIGKPAYALHQLVKGSDALPDAGRDEDGCIMFTTSGTTGAPRLALHTQASVKTHADEVAPVFGYDQTGTTLLQALPLCGTFGHAQAMSVLRAEGRLILMSVYGLEPALQLISIHQVSALNGADSMFEDMMREARSGELDSVGSGGFAAFVTPDVEDFVSRAERFGLELFGLYGMSEVQALFARQRSGSGVSERAQGGGYLTSTAARFRVCDPDTGNVLPPGQSGELQARGPSMFKEYYGNSAATQAALTDDGFLRTGDLAVDLGGGRFNYLARMGDSLRLGGFLASPAEIEAVVEKHPGVASCQVVGVDGANGTVPVAFVIATPGSNVVEDELGTLCANAMAKFKVPVRFIQLDAFPMTKSPNGEKIQRVKLRDMAIVAMQ